MPFQKAVQALSFDQGSPAKKQRHRCFIYLHVRVHAGKSYNQNESIHDRSKEHSASADAVEVLFLAGRGFKRLSQDRFGKPLVHLDEFTRGVQSETAWH